MTLFNDKICTAALPCPLSNGAGDTYRFDSFTYPSPATAGTADLVFTYTCVTSDGLGSTDIDNVSVARAA